MAEREPLGAVLDAIARAGAAPADAAEVTRGAVDASGRVAWIEGDVARLRVAAKGRILVDRKLNRQDEQNWGYEGCHVEYLRWWGERVVAVSSEERVTGLWSIGLTGESAFRFLSRPWVVEGDLAMWVSPDYPGLVVGAALPSLDPRLPLPIRGASTWLRLACDRGHLVVLAQAGGGWAVCERLALPSAGQRSWPPAGDPFLEQVERRLFPDREPTPSERLLVEATASPFCDDAGASPSWAPPPLWLPVYWHRHLVANGRHAEADRHLAVLDAVAAPLGEDDPERGWEPGWGFEEGAVRLAARYVRRQARVQAAACREGSLPPRWSCVLFYPAPGSSVPGSRVDPATLRPELRRVFEVLAPTPPPPFP